MDYTTDVVKIQYVNKKFNSNIDINNLLYFLFPHFLHLFTYYVNYCIVFSIILIAIV